MTSPFYPEGVTERDIDSIGEASPLTYEGEEKSILGLIESYYLHNGREITLKFYDSKSADKFMKVMEVIFEGE